MADRFLEPKDDQDPVQKALDIKIDNIETIYERMIMKMEVGCCLDLLLARDGALIAEYLSSNDLKLIRDINNYKPSSSSSIRSLKASSSRTVKLSSQLSQQDMNITKLLGILPHNKDVMNIVQKLLVQKSTAEKGFLNKMRDLQEKVVQILHTSAGEERAYNRRLGTSWFSNEKYKKKNAELEQMLDHPVIEYKDTDKIIPYKNIINSREQCNKDLEKTIHDSERELFMVTTKSEEIQEYLKETATQFNNQNQRLLSSDLFHEKVHRKKRYKKETVLSSLIAKYDEDMFELQAQEDEMEDGYNEIKEKLQELKDKFAEQTIQYNELMAEKKIEDARLLQIKIMKILKERSARKIQSWWRRILTRKVASRTATKSRKKGKGKKKI